MIRSYGMNSLSAGERGVTDTRRGSGHTKTLRGLAYTRHGSAAVLEGTGPLRSARPAARPSEATPLAAIMAVSRAVAEAAAVEDTLETIARTAASLTGGHAAAIVLRHSDSSSGLTLAGSWGLSPEYASELNRVRPIEIGSGPAGVAAATRGPVVVDDVLADRDFRPWRALAEQENYRAVLSVPLELGSKRRVIGALVAYRDTPGPWADEQIDLLGMLADHAAIAIQTAHLLDESRSSVRGLSLLVRSLRSQSHEHANLLHALSGLLALDEVDEARRLIAEVDECYRTARDRVSEAIENAVVSGFLLAETAIAGNSGIELLVEPESGVGELPETLGELDAVTILGNLIHNATEAVYDLPRERRRVSVLIAGDGGGLTIRVRDWGPGIPCLARERVFHPGYTTKQEHVGVGLALVRSIVARAGGEIGLEPDVSPGTSFLVRIPA
jgi:signal transduction histidine kinase